MNSTIDPAFDPSAERIHLWVLIMMRMMMMMIMVMMLLSSPRRTNNCVLIKKMDASDYSLCSSYHVIYHHQQQTTLRDNGISRPAVARKAHAQSWQVSQSFLMRVNTEIVEVATCLVAIVQAAGREARVQSSSIVNRARERRCLHWPSIAVIDINVAPSLIAPCPSVRKWVALAIDTSGLSIPIIESASAPSIVP